MVKSYFTAEKKIAFVSMGLGILTCSIASAYFISARPPFYTGLSLAFLTIGIAEVIVGASTARRSDWQAIDVQKLLGNDPKGFVEQETERMEKLLKSFTIPRIIGSLMVVTGIVLTVFDKQEGFLDGLGYGMMMQGVATQVYYDISKYRGKKYLEYVQNLFKNP